MPDAVLDQAWEVIVNFGENGMRAGSFLEVVTAVNMPLNCR